MYSVSSAFTSQAALKLAPWKRKFTIGSSDYSAFVLGWPTIERDWDDCAPASVTINATNAGRTFNFFLNDGATLHTSCSLQLGFDYVGAAMFDSAFFDSSFFDMATGTSSTEYITLLTGTVDAARFKDEKCAITLVDKFKQLADRVIGDSTTPTNYTSSNYLVHNLAWYVCTSHAGLSALTSTNNPDIDYASFSSWTSVFSADNVRMNAQFTGQKASEILKKIALLTQSAIWIENNKIKFMRFSLTDSAQTTLDSTTTIDGTQVMDERMLVNKVYVGAGYNVTSKSYGITVSNIDSASVVRYGLKERQINEDRVWYVDSVSALNLAQRTVNTGRDLLPQLTTVSPLQAIHVTIGDTIALSDEHLQLSDNYRVMGERINMDKGTKEFTFDQTQYSSAFRLDYSALDSSDTLG